MGNLPCEYNRIEYDRWFYDLGRSFCLKGNLSDALNCFCDAFLIRFSDKDLSQDWLTFFSVQFTSYLLGKRKMSDVSYPEGDMISQLIRDKWEEVKKELESSPMGLMRNLYEWSKTVEIDFPFELSCFDDFEDFDNLCQNDSKDGCFGQVG